MDYVNIEIKDNVYKLSVTLSENESHTPLFETNLPFITEFFKEFINSNIEKYLAAETWVGNMGKVILMDHLSTLISYTHKILSCRKIGGIYFRLLADVIFADDEESEEKQYLLVDTLSKNNHSDDMYNSILNGILLEVFKHSIKFEYGDCNLSDDYTEFLYKAFVDKLNDYYFGRINVHEWLDFLEAEREK